MIKIKNKDDIIGLHFEFNVGITTDMRDTMTCEDIMKLVEDKFSEMLEEEGLVPLGGKCESIKTDNEYGIRVF